MYGVPTRAVFGFVYVKLEVGRRVDKCTKTLWQAPALAASSEKCYKGKKSYKDVEELEDAFVSEDVEDISWRRVDDGQPVYLILQQGVDGIKQTEETVTLMVQYDNDHTWGMSRGTRRHMVDRVLCHLRLSDSSQSSCNRPQLRLQRRLNTGLRSVPPADGEHLHRA